MAMSAISLPGKVGKDRAGKVSDHPFGREDQVSVGQLWRFFCNNLYLGQWELARSCVRQLHQQRRLLGKNIHELLLDVVQNPYGYSMGGEGIPTPHHLSWLCLQEFTKLAQQDDSDIQVDIAAIKREVELRLLLVEISEHGDTTTINELYRIFKNLQSFRHNSEQWSLSEPVGTVPTLSTDSRDLLRQTLNTDPALGYALIQQLTSKDLPELAPHNEELQGIHLDCLSDMLSAIREKLSNNNDSDNMLSDSQQDDLRSSLSKFYSLLALFDPHPEMSKIPLKQFLRQMSELLHDSRSCDHGLSYKDVYTCLLGRETPFLLETFCGVDHENRMMKRSRDQSGMGVEMSDVTQQVLSLCLEGDRHEAWRDLLLVSLKHKKHFLDLIMETSMSLVKTHQFTRLSAMLSPLELQPLRPLVLLVGWDRCTDVDAAKDLLKALTGNKESACEKTVIDIACERLSYQVDLVQWCLHKTDSYLKLCDDSVQRQHASQLLHELETHSVLHMLHHTKSLPQLTHDDVLDILNNRPRKSDSGYQQTSSTQKSVRFSLDQDEQQKQKPTSLFQSIDVEKERDLSIYHSYCALQSFMEAMYFCADTVNWEPYISARNTLQTIHQRRITNAIRRQQRLASNHFETSSELTRSGSFGTKQARLSFGQSVSNSSLVSDTESRKEEREEEKIANALTALKEFQGLYKNKVIEHLKDGRRFLAMLQPLRIRVETLENIFSLLFLTNESIRDEITAVGNSDSGEEGAASESRSGSQVGSRDNLSTLENTLEKSCTPSPSSAATSLTFPISVPVEMVNRVEENVRANTRCKVVKEHHSSSEIEAKETLVGRFEISKTELKDTTSTTSDVQNNKKNSGNQSTNSACSIASVYKIGFLANPYIVRDMLMILKDCMADLNAAKYRLASKQQQGVSEEEKSKDLEEPKAREEVLNKHVTSSIETSSLQQRTSRLSQYISEASWRFQLVTPKQLPAEFGKIRTDKDVSEDEEEESAISDDNSAFSSDEEQGQIRHRRRRKTTQSSIASTTEESDSRPLTSGTAITTTTTATTDESSSQATGRSVTLRRRRKKRLMTLNRGGIMTHMLSGKSTLLNMCLRRTKYSQAQQVVKMFGMERSGNAAEVMFAEHYGIAVKTLHNLNNSSSSRPASAGGLRLHPTMHGGKPSLSAIADVAAKGMVTVSATTTVDQILSLNLLPGFSRDVLELAMRSASPLSQHINPDYIQAMIVLDLACVAPRIYESTANLVQMMSQRQPYFGSETPASTIGVTAGKGRMKRSVSMGAESTELPSSRKMSMGEKKGTMVSGEVGKETRRKASSAEMLNIPGIQGYMESVKAFITCGRTEANTEMADVYLKRSLNEVLLTATQPRDLGALVTYGHMMVELDRALGRVHRAMQEAHKQETLSLVQAVRAGHQGNMSSSMTSSGGDKPLIRQAMKHLMMTVAKCVPMEGIASNLLGIVGKKPQRKNEYLHRLYEHVKALSGLVHEAHGDKLVESTIEYFQMLDEGPTQILGKLIFVRRIPPRKLEDVANKLHVNMLQIIINNCCPLVSCIPTTAPSIALDEEEVGGKLVLNPSNSWSGTVQHPGTVVTEILTRLIGLLREYADVDSTRGIFTPSLMPAVVQDLRYFSLVAGLTQLKYIDLSLLETREDKLCFYGNLINLMTLHVLLRQVQTHVGYQESASHSRHSSFNTFTRQTSHQSPSTPLGSKMAASYSLSPLVSPVAGHLLAGDLEANLGLPDGELEWLILQDRAAYHVGQLGVTSLFELKYFILRNGLPPPSSYGGIIKDRCHELDLSDPWKMFGPQPEPRSLFIISEGHVSSPPLQVLSREMVLTQLRGAMKDYLQKTISVDLDANLVVLPQLLVWHQNDLATDHGKTSLPCEGLLNLLPTQLDAPLADDLRTLMDRHADLIHADTSQKPKKDLQVIVKPYLMDHVYMFDFDQFSHLHPSPAKPANGAGLGHRRCASLPFNPSTKPASTHQHSDSTMGQNGQREDLFHLTPTSISYLRSRSELVATLASIVGLIDRLDLQKVIEEDNERSLSPTGNLGHGRRGRRRSGADSRATSPETIDEQGSPLKVPSSRSRPSSCSPNTRLGAQSSRSESPASKAPSSSSDGANTIAEYRYLQLLQHFPHVWRHMLHQVVPLEMSRDPDLLAAPDNNLPAALCHRELSADSRVSVLVSPADNQMYQAAMTLTRILMLQRDWLSLVRLLRSLPELLLHSYRDLQNLHDFACCCVAFTSGETLEVSDTDSNDLWRHLLLVQDATTRSRAVLSMAQFWPVEVAVELLTACYYGNHPRDKKLYETLGKRLEETKIYQRVTESAKTLCQKVVHHTSNLSDLRSVSDDGQEPIADQQDQDEAIMISSPDELTAAILEPLCTWQNVVSCSMNNPERVLKVLLESHEFEVARKWGAIHKIDARLKQKIEESYIAFLLEVDNPNQAEAFQVLERVLSKSPENCLSLCGDLLMSLRHRGNTSFVASFMLRHLTDYINKYRQEELRLLLIGCQALLCLPDSASRVPYDHLVPAPALLIETLLMNSKIEWVSRILTMLKTDFCQVPPSSTTSSVASPSSSPSRHSNIIPTSFDISTCDTLLVKYATKALEFPILRPEMEEPPTTPGRKRADSISSIASQGSVISHNSQLSSFGGPMGVAVVTTPPPPRVVHVSHSSNTLAPQRSITPIPTLTTSAPRSITPTSSRPRRHSAVPQLGIARSPSQSTSAQTGSSDGKFVMPSEPPTKDKWVPDSAAVICMVCEVERFSMFVRRHHCRRCGRVVCAGCSGRTMMIRGTSARVCDQCFNQSFRAKDGEDRMQRLKDRLSGVSSGSGSAPFQHTTIPEWNEPTESDDGDERQAPTVSFLTDYTYQLSLDEDQNDVIREEFYYDQAPSTSLCLSILELLSSPKECGDTVLRLCDDVSRYLQPLAPGVRNSEVDYGLVISMLKYLLFNAKVKLLSSGDNTGVARCDVYLGRLVLLRQLVAANCSYVPSMQQLNKMDALRRLRDRLIQEERLPLAMDISTKCGIDPQGVWAAWGMTALRAGDYTTARDKFSHCLKTPVDKNLPHQSTKLLSDIIEQLESGTPPTNSPADGLLAPLRSMKDLLAEPQSVSVTDTGSKEEAVSRECLFYLNTYGTHSHLVTFYLRHGNMNKAVHYILDRRCNREVFVESLVIPSLSSGKLTRLQDAMMSADPMLEKWSTYIIAMCRYLDKHKLINTLYQTQLFIKDFIRAAMTCITYFYQKDASNYSTLADRLNHLLNAKHHLECYLSDRQWGTTGHVRSGAGTRTPGEGSSTLRLIMTPGEVNKYINTISLQIDVTKFLQRYSENLDTVMTNLLSLTPTSPGAATPQTPSATLSRSSSLSLDTPATLFGSTRMKADVTNLVLLAGNNVNDGFGLAFRIIQDFRLDSTFIYVQAGRYFARLHKYSSVKQLLSCIKDSGLCTDQSFDDVITACVKVISGDPGQAKEAETLTKLIRSDASKVNAYILCGKLKSAYLIAVKGERVEDIKRISVAAERTGQASVKKICDKWLAGRIRAQQLMAAR